MEEFLAVFSKWAVELDLDRLLLPPPSHLWRQLAMDGHWGPGFVKRNAIPLRARETRRALSPTPWHFRSRNASVCLYNDARLHHLSAAGLEIIPAANIQGAGSRLTWLSGNTWKTDPFQVTSPPPSEGHRYYQSKPIQLPDAQGLTAMQRGYTWETIQWWIGTENGILWISQLISHAFLTCDKLRYILGNPVLTQVSNAAVPVTELETAEGIKTDTQGESVSISSGKFLRFGDVFVGATSPLEFGRPSRDAFHTFPLPPGTFLRDFSCSNELRVQLSETPPQVECRDSLFFAVEIGNQAPSLSAHRDPLVWTLKAKSGCFVARQREGIWSYTFETHSGHAELPRIGFRFRT
jgi:hypothetical protein